jgi:hypothetical protein
MALFRVSRGDSSNLPSVKTDGWAYFCSDTGEFFIDYTDLDGNLQRKKINESHLQSLQTLVGDVAVSTQINNAVSKKSQVRIVTWGDDD